MFEFLVRQLTIICAVWFVVVFIYRIITAPRRRWLSYLTIEEYWKKYPTCKTQRGTKCYYCYSGNIRQFGLTDSRDKRRIHRCNQCNNNLYRS